MKRDGNVHGNSVRIRTDTCKLRAVTEHVEHEVWATTEMRPIGLGSGLSVLSPVKDANTFICTS